MEGTTSTYMITIDEDHEIAVKLICILLENGYHFSALKIKSEIMYLTVYVFDSDTKKKLENLDYILGIDPSYKKYVKKFQLSNEKGDE